MIPVLIPAFQNPEQLAKCIAAVQLQPQDTEIFIRDNSEDNILYTKAINEGLRKYAFCEDIEHILVITQDCFLKDNCFSELLVHMKENPKCGIACPIQLSSGGNVTYGGGGECFPYGNHVINSLKDYDQGPFPTYWANGACFLIRTALIREIGLLDENMRFICSDADYSFTARARGWDCCVVPTALCEHEPDGAKKFKNHWLDSVKNEDALYFTNKWFSGELGRVLSFEGHKITHQQVRAQVSLLSQLVSGLRKQK